MTPSLILTRSTFRAFTSGRLVRVYNVPSDAEVYRVLLSSGVDLIGTKDIHGAHELLIGDR